jgi:hypothetical protein
MGVICERAELSTGTPRHRKPFPDFSADAAKEEQEEEEEEEEEEAPNLVLAVVRSHTARVVAYLKDEATYLGENCRVLGWQPRYLMPS